LSSTIIGGIIAIVLVAIAVAALSMISATKRPCPHCHTMMPKGKTTCPKCGKGIPLNY
jgi:predicted amidophosphoribosyltransferase